MPPTSFAFSGGFGSFGGFFTTGGFVSTGAFGLFWSLLDCGVSASSAAIIDLPAAPSPLIIGLPKSYITS